MYKSGLEHKTVEEVFSEDYKFLKNEYNQEIRHDKNKILYYNKMVHLYFRDEDIIELLKDEIRNEMWSYVVFKIPDKNKDINELNEVYFIVDIFPVPRTVNLEAKAYLYFSRPISDEAKINLRRMPLFREIIKMLIHIEKTYPDVFLSNMIDAR